MGDIHLELMNTLFEPKPRWPGAPPVCLAQNLPAFKDRAELDAFRQKNAPGFKLQQVWQCDHCGCLHYWAEPTAPSGESSGTARANTGSAFNRLRREIQKIR